MPDRGSHQPSLSARQREALAWLRARGKASQRLVREAGFADRTFEALRDAGLIDWRWVGVVNPKFVVFDRGTSRV